MSATQMGMEPTMAGMPMPPRDLLQMAGQQGREMDMQNQQHQQKQQKIYKLFMDRMK